MQLEKQVVSLELAKKLKELGVRQESYFIWKEYRDGMFSIYDPDEHPYPWSGSQYSAFSVAELGEMLPGVLSGNCGSGFKAIRGSVLGTHAETCATEADARAKMLIYLIEKKIVKPKGRKG